MNLVESLRMEVNTCALAVARRPEWDDSLGLIGRKMAMAADRIVELEAALRRARPYVYNAEVADSADLEARWLTLKEIDSVLGLSAIQSCYETTSTLETSVDVGRPGGDMTCEVTYRQGPNGVVEIISEKCYEPKIKGVE